MCIRYKRGWGVPPTGKANAPPAVNARSGCRQIRVAAPAAQPVLTGAESGGKLGWYRREKARVDVFYLFLTILSLTAWPLEAQSRTIW